MLVTTNYSEESAGIWKSLQNKKHTRLVVLITCVALLVVGVAVSTSKSDNKAGVEKNEWITKAQGDAFVTSGTYEIIAVVSGKALDVSGNSAAAPIIQNTRNGGKSQEWILEGVTGSTDKVFIKSASSGMYMDIYGASGSAGGKLIQYPLHKGANQQFRVETLSDGNVRIQVVHSGQYLDVPGSSTINSIQIIQWPWHGGSNQRFQLVSKGCPSPIVRKDWSDLTQAERDTFLNGFKQLRTNGVLAKMTEEHGEASVAGFDGATFHGNGGFLPWHRYFLWELEHQIRKLGGSYACVALPYWDWSRTSGNTVGSNLMFSQVQGLGGNGQGSGWCVPDGLLSVAAGYRLSNGQCLSRNFRSGTHWYQTTQQTLEAVELSQSYTSFRSTLEGYHNNAHVSIGGTLLSVFTAPDDPTFYMLHGYVDMVWALRSDCHNYDQATSMNSFIFDGTASAPMTYPVLDKESWALVNSRSLTAGDLMKTSQWGYTYDSSNMISRTSMSMSGCTFDSISGRAVKEWQTQEDGVGDVAHAANVAAHRMSVFEDASDAQIAEAACEQVDGGCSYNGQLDISICGDGKSALDISLTALLNQGGVKGVACITDHRKYVYDFAKSIGTLHGMCTGKTDPVCVVA